MTKVWFITGSSPGLGRNLAEAALRRGDKVVATARHLQQLKYLEEEYPQQVLLLPLDVTNKQQIKEAVNTAIQHFGRIDVLVNNAGFGITGAAEAFTGEQVSSQVEANLYGPIEITRAVLPNMRKQRSGRILQIASIGGRIGTPGLTIYQAAKFGLVGFSEALAQEVAPLGIHVTSVEPGGFRTDWAGDSMTFAPAVEGYETTADWIRSLFTTNGFVPHGDPAKAANVLVDLANHPQPPVHLVLGSDAIAMLKRSLVIMQEEMEKWMPVSLSTDHDDAVNFLETDAGKKLAGANAR